MAIAHDRRVDREGTTRVKSSCIICNFKGFFLSNESLISKEVLSERLHK